MTMPTEQVGIDLALNNDDYISGVQGAIGPTEALGQAIGQVHEQGRGLAGFWDKITPGRAAIAGMTAFTAGAALMQHELAGLHATQAVTGQSASILAKGIREVARELPGGQRQAAAVVNTYQQLGLTMKGQEGQVRALAKASIELGGATGESAVGLAAQTTQLDRQFGSLSPTRVKALNDSLVRTQKTVGGTASGILSFADAIGPFAKQAGLGETAVIGISGAFSRLGADGIGATTAISKVISDLNRSVRDGSNEMGGYAQAVGMTTAEFAKLYKSNPAEALVQVTEALGKPGPQGQRTLESLGFGDSVRTQRYLSALAQSGGLRQSMEASVSGYGSGDTTKAAHAAFNNLADDMSKLASTSAQTGEALGTPFLGPLQKLTHVATSFAGVTAGVMGSKPIQFLLGIAGYGAAIGGAGLLLGAGGVKGLAHIGTAAFVSQMATSGPIAGGLGGFATGRGQALQTGPYGLGTGRFGGRMIALNQAGQPLGRSPFMANLNQRFFGFGQQFGESYENVMQRGLSPQQIAARQAAAGGLASAPAGPGLRSRLWRAVAMPTSLAYEGYMRSFVANPATLASMHPADRDTIRAQGAFATARDASGAAWQRYTGSSMTAGNFNVWRTEMAGIRKTLVTELGATSAEFGNFRRVLRATTAATAGSARFGGSMLGGAAMGIGRGLMNFVGWPMLLMGGAMAGYSMVKGDKQRRAESEQQYGAMGEYSMLDRYNESLGLAGQSTTTFSQQADEAAKTMQAAVKTFSEAQKVSADDTEYAHRTKSQQTSRYSGLDPLGRMSSTDIEGTAAQIRSMSAMGLTPQQVQAAKVDLLRQGIPEEYVNQVMSSVTQGSKGGLTAPISRPQQLAATTTAAHRERQSSGPGFFSRRNFFGPTSHALGFGRGGHFDPAHASQGTKDQVERTANLVEQHYKQNKAKYGAAYAGQARLAEMQAEVNAALSQGDDDYMIALTNAFRVQLGMHEGSMTTSDIAAAGGFVPSLQKHGDYNQAQNATSAVGGKAAPVARSAQLGETGQLFAKAGTLGTPLGQSFNNMPGYGDRSINKLMSRVTEGDLVGNLPATQRAIDRQIGQYEKAGISLDVLAQHAAKSAAGMDNENDARFKLMTAIEDEARLRVQHERGSMTPREALTSRIREAQAGMDAYRNAPTAEGHKRFLAYREELAQTKDEERDMLKARLMAQLQFQIASRRANEDYQISTTRMREDYNTSRARADEDYNRSRLRAEQDFNLQMSRSQQDYLISRNRAVRDFNISMGRQVEDAAKQMLNPFERLKTAQIWDTRDLLGNMARQNQQMATQKGDLGRAKKMGLSQQVIDMLGLANPDNAQQLAQMIDDMMSDPKLVTRLNRTSKTRKGLAGGLVTESVDYKRAKEDFNRQLHDQEHDYNRSVSRSQADFKRSMNRQHTDFLTSMNRSAQDFHKALVRGEADFNRSMTRMQEDLHTADLAISADFSVLMEQTERAIHGQAVDWGKLIHNSVTGQIAAIKENITDLDRWQKTGPGKRMIRDINSNIPGGAGQSFNPNVSTGGAPYAGSSRSENIALAKKMAGPYGWGSGKEWSALEWLWNQESGFNQYAGSVGHAYGIPQSDPGSKMKSAGSDWETNPKTQIKWGLNYISDTYGRPSAAMAHKHHTDTNLGAPKSGLNQPGGWYGEGAMFVRGTKVIGAGERGDEMVLPLNGRGIEFLAAAFGKAIGHDDYRAMATAGHATHIHYHNESVSYDQRRQFTGPIHVSGVTDLEGLMDEVEERTARDNFTGSRGRS